MKRFILLTICFILILSCEDNLNDSDIDLNRPKVFLNDSLDVNNDKVIDFVIIYEELATLDIPSSGGRVIGSIRSLNQNQLLYRKNVGYLFLRINEKIGKVSNTDAEWNGSSADLIGINRNYKNWDKAWTVNSDQLINNFLAYKIKKGDSEKIGWLCLDFDIKTGKIAIKHKVISEENELVIQK